MSLKPNGKTALFAALAMLLPCLGGCSADDVQLNGKIFDAMGMNTSSVKRGDPKLAVREPLVVPPGLDSLPAPGTGGKAEQPSLAEIQDPDAKAKVTKAELEKQQEEFCKANYEPAVARGDASADSLTGPLGSCHKSVFTALKKWNSGDNEGDGEDQ